MSVIGTARLRRNAFGVSNPGTLVTIFCPGLKPSLRFQSVGLIGTFWRLRGMSETWRFSRRPVSVVPSATVKWSFGQGWRHTAGSSGSHAASAGADGKQRDECGKRDYGEQAAGASA